MASSGFKLIFLIFNFLYWVVGAALIGVIAWSLATIPNASEFLSGTFVFSYACLCVGLLVVIIGIIGCIGGLSNSLCALKTYVGLMTTMLLIEIAMIIAIYAIQMEIPKLIESTWEQLNKDTHNLIQNELECCGIQNHTEYSTDYTQLPDSCFKTYQTLTVVTKSESTLFTSSCLDKMQDWLNNNMPIWISVLVAIVIIQLASSMCSCIILSKINTPNKISPSPEPKSLDEITSETGEKQRSPSHSLHEPSTSSFNKPTPTSSLHNPSTSSLNKHKAVLTIYSNPDQV